MPTNRYRTMDPCCFAHPGLSCVRYTGRKDTSRASPEDDLRGRPPRVDFLHGSAGEDQRPLALFKTYMYRHIHPLAASSRGCAHSQRVRRSPSRRSLLMRRPTAPPSLAVFEQRKRQRLSEWKGSLTEEDTVRNTNFAPIGGNWHDRVARARQRKAAEGAAPSVSESGVGAGAQRAESCHRRQPSWNKQGAVSAHTHTEPLETVGACVGDLAA